MAAPWISVLMPVYNGEEYLCQALDSILIQQDGGIEIIAVDDGSADSTPTILDSYSKKLHIKIFRQTRTGKPQVNTDRALSLAQAEYVSILHQDDLWLGGRLKIMRDLTLRYPDVNLFIHAVRFIDNRGRPLGLLRAPLGMSPSLVSSDKVLERLLVQNFISISAPVFRRKAAMESGGIDHALSYAYDWDLWLRMAHNGGVFYHSEALSAFRIHTAAQTMALSLDIGSFGKELDTVLERHLKFRATADEIKKRAGRLGRFSNKVNVTLASIAHHKRSGLLPIITRFITLGPAGWYRYMRDSRIIDRVRARVKANLSGGTSNIRD